MNQNADEKPLGFLKTTMVGAVLVVVPTGIVGFALWQIGSLFQALLLPLVEKLPFDSVFMRYAVIFMALTAVVLLCFFTGVSVRTRWGAAMRGWIERRFLERIPGYSVVRTLIHQYLGQDGGRQFRPVLVDLYGSDSRAVGFEIELLEDGKVAVFLPSVPAATIGQVQLVPQDRVYPLKASMHATLEALTMFGMGASKLVTAEADERTDEGEIPGQS